jgi:23S rRNA A2030 N6-methylase RlmJ
MPNRHFAEIGDIWKHLPIASVLISEKKELKHYWETHSGSALYDLKQTDKDLQWKKDYGAHYFNKNCKQIKHLQDSPFQSILNRWVDEGTLTHYPGTSAARKFPLLITQDPH